MAIHYKLGSFNIYKAFSLFLLYTAIFFNNFSKAQLVADFTGENVKGCAPLEVQFTDHSSGNIVSRTWTFGNGNTAKGNKLRPGAIYSKPGKYTVTLEVSDGNNKHTVTKPFFITVLSKPVPDFTVSGKTSGCFPMNVQFVLSSGSLQGSLKKYNWSFGEGGNSTLQDPAYTYTAEGRFSVTLNVEDTNGCNGYKRYDNLITVKHKPVASLMANPTKACGVPHSIGFVDKSTSYNGPLQRTWNMGDKNTMQGASFYYKYTDYGSYDIGLKVTDSLGCSDSVLMKNYVMLENISTSGEVQISKTIACKGEVLRFYNYFKTNATDTMISYGDGTKGRMSREEEFVTHAYKTSGDKQVNILLNYGPLCRDTLKYTVHIDTVKALFARDSNYVCQIPANIKYTDRSFNATRWQWTFWNKLEKGQPIFSSFYGKEPGTIHYFNHSYPDTLVVWSSAGCIDKYFSPFKEADIKPVITSNPSSSYTGCDGPLTVNFTEASTPKDSLSKWRWEFPDDKTSSDKQFPDPHTFEKEGHFYVKLAVTNRSGCTHSGYQEVFRGSTQHPDFIVSPLAQCGNNIFSFRSTSQDSNKIEKYTWTISKENKVYPEYHKQFSFKFDEAGKYDVKLTVENNNCFATKTLNELINVIAPCAVFSVDEVCKRFTYKFTSKASGATEIKWDLGDGTFINNVNTLEHTYKNAGNYTIKFYTFNSMTGCRDTSVQYINVSYPYARIKNSGLSYGCSPYYLASVADSFSTGRYFTWIVNGETRIDNGDSRYNYSQEYWDPINYLELIVKDFNGCEERTAITVRTFKPFVEFEVDKPIACDSTWLHFTDKTNPRRDTTIARWHWVFADGDTSNVKNPVKMYYAEARYHPRLEITDVLGCRSMNEYYTNEIWITNPAPEIETMGYSCLHDSSWFHAGFYDHQNVKEINWDLGDGAKVTAEWLKHLYADTGIYVVTMSAKGYGCTRSRSVKFRVFDHPVPEISIDSVYSDGKMMRKLTLPVTGNCYPMTVYASPRGKLDNVQTYVWKFGGLISNNTNPAFVCEKPDVYDIGLTSSSPWCYGTVNKPGSIIVKGPVAEVEITPPYCANAPIHFNTKNVSEATNFRWDFSDGTIERGEEQWHTFQQNGKVFPTLLFSGEGGACPKQVTDTILLHSVTAAFAISDSMVCQNGKLDMTNLSLTEPVTGLKHCWWSFEDKPYTQMDCSPLQVQFKNSNVQTVRLKEESNAGCLDSAWHLVMVNELPSINIKKDTLICLGQTTKVWASGKGAGYEHFKWNKAEMLSEDTLQNPVVKPSGATIYTVTLTDHNGCVNTNATLVDVQQPPLPVLNQDSIVVIAEPVRLNVFAGRGYVYKWNPQSYLSCSDCPNPIVQALDDITYKVQVNDTSHCFSAERQVTIKVKKEYSLDVPEAFTPNGDGHNDVISIKGWGIKRVVEFKIYNRWGELMFQTDDINQGWDGYYKGKLQNVETYAYSVIIETYDGKNLTKKGMINLLK